KPLGGAEPLTKTELDWNTEAVPDGNYLVRVLASDERANPKDRATEAELVSQPFLVDNRKPELDPMQVKYPYVSGRAHDSFSPIAELAFSVDGGDWQIIYPQDGLYDELSERFTLRLPQGLTAGTHTLAVRASDGAGNLGASQVTFKVSADEKG